MSLFGKRCQISTFEKHEQNSNQNRITVNGAKVSFNLTENTSSFCSFRYINLGNKNI